MTRRKTNKWLKVTLWIIGSLLVLIIGGIGFLYLKYARSQMYLVPWRQDGLLRSVRTVYIRNTPGPRWSDLAIACESLFRDQLIPLIDKGVNGAVYMQTTDVESEINGLMTYDRAVDKIDPSRLRSLHNEVYSKLNATAGK